MERVSIICLIYKSTDYAEFVYDNIRRYTPELDTWGAEFFFVANDATPEVLDFLKTKKYPHLINNNPTYTDEERYSRGFAIPEYMSKVYMGYNFGMRMAKSPILMLVSSDNCFSPHWLPNLRKRLTHHVVVSPKLIQPLYPFENPINLTPCLVGEFGTGIKTFDECGFLQEVSKVSVNSESIGVAFMPLMIYKDVARAAGYYPEGNLHGGDYNRVAVYGDQAFYKRLSKMGVKHITSNDSIVYHFNEGEKLSKLE